MGAFDPRLVWMGYDTLTGHGKDKTFDEDHHLKLFHSTKVTPSSKTFVAHLDAGPCSSFDGKRVKTTREEYPIADLKGVKWCQECNQKAPLPRFLRSYQVAGSIQDLLDRDATFEELDALADSVSEMVSYWDDKPTAIALGQRFFDRLASVAATQEGFREKALESFFYKTAFSLWRRPSAERFSKLLPELPQHSLYNMDRYKMDVIEVLRAHCKGKVTSEEVRSKVTGILEETDLMAVKSIEQVASIPLELLKESSATTVEEALKEAWLRCRKEALGAMLDDWFEAVAELQGPGVCLVAVHLDEYNEPSRLGSYLNEVWDSWSSKDVIVLRVPEPAVEALRWVYGRTAQVPDLPVKDMGGVVEAFATLWDTTGEKRDHPMADAAQAFEAAHLTCV